MNPFVYFNASLQLPNCFIHNGLNVALSSVLKNLIMIKQNTKCIFIVKYSIDVEGHRSTIVKTPGRGSMRFLANFFGGRVVRKSRERAIFVFHCILGPSFSIFRGYMRWPTPLSLAMYTSMLRDFHLIPQIAKLFPKLYKMYFSIFNKLLILYYFG